MKRSTRRSLTGRGRAFVAAGVVLAATGLYLGFEDIVRFGVLLLALAVLAWLFARRPAPSLTVEHAVQPPTVAPDQRAQVTVGFTNTGRRSTPLLLAEERVDYLLGDRPRFVLARVEPGGRREITFVVRSPLRGRYPLGPVAVQQRDPFGLTTVDRVLTGTGDLLVLPRVVPLGSSHPPGTGLGAEGETPQMVSSQGEEDVSIRAYHDGDDLRRVHWPATAHRGELMVRQEDRPARRSAVVLLDSRAAFHRGSGTRSSFEWAVSAVASILARLDELGYRLHMATRESLHQQPAADASIGSMIYDLASATTGSDQDFTTLVHRTLAGLSTGGIVVAVLTPGSPEIHSDLAGLRQPGASALGIVLDTGERDSASDRPSDAAAALRDRLAASGWRVVVVDEQMSVEQAWGVVTNRALIQVGSL